jgi:hypothetical protein
VPKEQILRIIRGENIGKRMLAKMAKSGMSPTVLSSLALIQNDPMKRQRIISEYFEGYYLFHLNLRRLEQDYCLSQ